MKLINVDEQIQELDNKVVEPQAIEGWQLRNTPRPAMTAPDGQTVDATYGTQERDVINNHTTRIGELETALVKLNLIKSR